jgi:hypothetical protein
MKTLLSVIVAAMFASVSVNAFAASHAGAQSKDVTTKSGGAVADKAGTNVKTKEPKERPKGGPVPKIEKKAKKEKPATTEVKTKSGGAVTTKDNKDVKSTK